MVTGDCGVCCPYMLFAVEGGVCCPYAIGFGCWSTGNITDEMVNQYLEHHRNPNQNVNDNFERAYFLFIWLHFYLAGYFSVHSVVL